MEGKKYDLIQMAKAANFSEKMLEILTHPNNDSKIKTNLTLKALNRFGTDFSVCLIDKYRSYEEMLKIYHKEIVKEKKPEFLNRKFPDDYPDPDTTFNFKQAEVINECLECGLPFKKIKYIADTHYSAEKMRQLMYAFMDGITFEEAEILCNEELTALHMEEGRYLMIRFVSWNRVYNEFRLRRISLDTAKDLINIKDSSKKIRQIRFAIENGLDSYQIYFLRKKHCHALKIEYLRKKFEEGLNVDQVKYLYSVMWLSADKLEQVEKGLKQGLTVDQIKMYVNCYVSDVELMKEIRYALAAGISMEKVELLTNDKISSQKARMLRIAMMRGLPMEDIFYLKDHVNSDSKCADIHFVLSQGMCMSDIKKVISADISTDQLINQFINQKITIKK